MTHQDPVDATRRLDTLAIGVVELDLDGRVTYANASALQAMDRTMAQVIGQSLADAGFGLWDRAGAPWTPPPRRPGSEDPPVRQVVQCKRPSGPELWLDLQAVGLRDATGQQVGTLLSFLDVDPPLSSAAERVADRMRDALDSMAAGVVVVDPDGRIEYANRAAAAVTGLEPEDVVGQLVADPAWQLTDERGNVLAYEALPVPTALRERRAVKGVELGVPSTTGTTRWIRVSVQPIFDPDDTLRGAAVTTEDVTERHQIAEQLLQAQKLESLGQLAGGVAHDFNNLLTVILCNAELALTMPSADGHRSEMLEIREAAKVGEAITRKMLTFARKEVIQPQAIQLGQLVGSLERLLRRLLGETIDLHQSSDAKLWAVSADPVQVEQVLLNLAVNARDAMPAGGSLAIEARNVHVGAALDQRPPSVAAGDFVALEVTDTGAGIPADVLPRIFDPFFTTKSTGSGTGIGLSTCVGIVKQAGGFIAVDTELERGTTFTVYLPRTQGVSATDTRRRQTPRATPPSGSGTILLVEDQEPVRTLVARILRGYGYDVVTAHDGQDALAAYERMAVAPDLVLTDVVMPRMNGPELADALSSANPGLAIVFMTGFLDTATTPLHGPIGARDVLLKPFSPMQLLDRVKAALSRSTAPAEPAGIATSLGGSH